MDPARQLAKLGLRIVELREARGLTQEQLAELAVFSRRKMQKLEAGTANTTVKGLVALATALRCPVAQLFAPTERTIRRRSGRPRSR